MSNDPSQLLSIMSNRNCNTRILSIDPGYANMGMASVIFDATKNTAMVTSIDIVTIGNKKSRDLSLIDNMTHYLETRVKGKYDCCVIEKQGGFAQTKVIRIEQHITTMLQHVYNIPVYIFSPKLRNRIKNKEEDTAKWLTESAEHTLINCAPQELLIKFRTMTPKQKTDIGAAITQISYLLGIINS